MELHPELTNFNGGAFDLLRLKNAGQKMPFWLCMSKESKADAQLHFANWCRSALSIAYEMSDQDIVQMVNNMPTSFAIEEWKRIEMETASTRADGSLDYFI